MARTAERVPANVGGLARCLSASAVESGSPLALALAGVPLVLHVSDGDELNLTLLGSKRCRARRARKGRDGHVGDRTPRTSYCVPHLIKERSLVIWRAVTRAHDVWRRVVSLDNGERLIV